jgi:hypothetical protein
MIGFSIEFKRWYFVLRGPKGRIYLATGFAKRMPVFTPTGTLTLDDYLDDSHSAVLADEWRDDETDAELLQQLKDIR